MKKSINLIIVLTITILLTGCFNNDKNKTEYKDYIQSAMDASYLGKSSQYLELANTTKEDAEELYNSTIEYLSYSLMKYNNVNYDVINNDIIEKYNELAKKALTKTKYVINDARKVDGIYQVKLEITPLDVWESTYDEVEEYIAEFIDKYPNYDSMTDEELIELEEEYAENILEILTPYVDNMTYKDTVNKIVEIQFDEDGLYGISDDEWNDIDDYVMGIK